MKYDGIPILGSKELQPGGVRRNPHTMQQESTSVLEHVGIPILSANQKCAEEDPLLKAEFFGSIF